MERALIVEFEECVAGLLSALREDNLGNAITVVRLYMDIRGYGPVKEQAVKDVRAKVAAHAIMHE
jgi:indolepyruvate ferredoxin oxidoreductase